MLLKRIGVLSCGLVAGVVYAGLGLVIGTIVSLLSMLGVVAGLATDEGPGALIGVLFGIGAIVLLPILYGLIGLVSGLLMALFYNLAAQVTGGVEVQLEPRP